MNPDDDVNPFADPSIRQATQQTFTNQQTLSEYNPFSNATVAAKVNQGNPEAFVPSTLPPPPPTYASSAAGQQTTRVDLSQLERQQAELEQREKRLAERERELGRPQAPQRDKNFPPLPAWFPLRPCFYQDIGVEIPNEFQIWVRYLYYLWLLYSGTLALNIVAAFAYLMVDKTGAATFGLSILYCIIFVPCSYVCWFRPIYRAFRSDRSVDYMIFFFISFFQICLCVFMVLGWKNSGFCGFILMIQMFSSGGKKIIVGLLVMVVTFGFATVGIAGGLLLVKVHRLYRQSGATLEQAQREFQSAFVNNPTVRGAAQEVATAGFNQTVRGTSYPQ